MSALTIRDIAKICEVSTSTVSRAMNGDPGINKDTKARILQVIEEYNFVPNNSARNLKMIESETIGLLIKGVDNPFFQGMLRIFGEELKKESYSFIIQYVSEDQDEVNVAAELVKEKKLRGIIFLGGLTDNPGGKLNNIGIPYVRCTGATYVGDTSWGGTTISIDDEKESYNITDYLLNKGHTRIALISSRKSDISVGRLRQEGYERALKDHGVRVDRKLICYADESMEPYSVESGYAVMKRLIASKVDCTAVYAISDMVAFGVYKAIQEAGRRIPEDYSVIGFDGLALTQYFVPALTTMKQPGAEMVRASIRELMKAINEEPHEQQIIYRASMIERDSVRRL